MIIKKHVFRLHLGQDLKKEISAYTSEHSIKAGVLLSSVGNLKKVVLRMVDASLVKEWEGTYEIVSATGTVEAGHCHVHISISDTDGNVYGGHLKD